MLLQWFVMIMFWANLRYDSAIYGARCTLAFLSWRLRSESFLNFCVHPSIEQEYSTALVCEFSCPIKHARTISLELVIQSRKRLLLRLFSVVNVWEHIVQWNLAGFFRLSCAACRMAFVEITLWRSDSTGEEPVLVLVLGNVGDGR